MITEAALTAWVLLLGPQMLDRAGFHKAIPLPLAAAIAHGALAHPLSGSAPKTAAELVMLAFREGSYRTDVVGDHDDPHGQFSYGTFQTKQCAPYTCAELLKDERKQVDVALRILHRSESMCPAHPLAPYAQGFCSRSDGQVSRGEKISDERMGVVSMLLRTPLGDEEDQGG